jgi:hypothetical protein
VCSVLQKGEPVVEWLVQCELFQSIYLRIRPLLNIQVILVSFLKEQVLSYTHTPYSAILVISFRSLIHFCLSAGYLKNSD